MTRFLRKHPAIDDRWRQSESFYAVEDRREQPPRHSHFGKLERHVFRVPRHLRSDLDEFLSKGCQRPVLHITGQGQSPQFGVGMAYKGTLTQIQGWVSALFAVAFGVLLIYAGA